MQVGAKGALFLAIVLLLGAGLFARWIARDGSVSALRPRIRTGAWVGAVLLVGGSALDVIDTISRATGSFDLSLILPYVSETKHGNAVLARVAIGALLPWIATPNRGRAGADSAAFVGLGVALLLTFSLVSHAGAQSGLLPVSADLLHLTGVAAWGGALVYGAWLVPWQASGTAVLSVERAVGRLSTVGAWGVTLIVATGVYASLKNLWGPRALTETPYGRALLIKLAFVAMVLGVAAVNRWVLIPSLTRGVKTPRLGGLVKIESLLLLAVLGVTAALVSQSPPGPPPTLSRPLTLREAAGPWIVRGTLERRDPGRFAIELNVHDATGGVAPAGVTVDLTLTMLEHEMTPVRTTLAEIRPGTYNGTFFLPMTGRWQMTVQAGPYTAQIPVQTEDAVFIEAASPWRVVLPGVTVVLAGLGFMIVGLRRMGTGVRGLWPVIGAGIVLFIIGVLLAIRAANY
jgi:copper resistance protein D